MANNTKKTVNLFSSNAEQRKTTANATHSETPMFEDLDKITESLIKDINKESGSTRAYNLSTDEAPTNIKRWISTDSIQLDYIISNKKNVGGLPEGRIIEIQGPPSCGKSHICFAAAKNTQKMGGIVVYIDTENATSPENLANLGIDVSKRFVFIQETCMEEIFKIIETTIEKVRNMKKDIPVLVVWDSIAGSSPKAEIEGDYDQNTIGLAARVLSKGFRKITEVIGNTNATLLLVNQQRMKIGVMYGDPTTTPGGNAIPYHASLRLKVSSGTKIEKEINGKTIPIGITVDVKTIKNKVARPWREVTLDIIFGQGLRDGEHLFDSLRIHCEKTSTPTIVDGKKVLIEGTGAWKLFSVTDSSTGEVLIEKKFQKSGFERDILNNKEYQPYMKALLDDCFVLTLDKTNHTVAAPNLNNAAEVEALSSE